MARDHHLMMLILKDIQGADKEAERRNLKGKIKYMLRLDSFAGYKPQDVIENFNYCIQAGYVYRGNITKAGGVCTFWGLMQEGYYAIDDL